MNSHPLIHPILPQKHYAQIIKVKTAAGATVIDQDGQSYLDGISGLWNTILGHGNKEIEGAITRQMQTVSFVNPWTSCTEIAYQLAEQLIAFTNRQFDKVMYTCTGSEAVELAIKLIRRHHSAAGHHDKKYIGVFETSYHGTHYGSMTATGIDKAYYKPYGPMLQGFAYLPIPFEEKGTVSSSIKSLEDFFTAYGERIGGFILEPVLGVSGVVKLSSRYLKRLKSLCEEYDVLLVFDEISTGFYRTGPKFAYEDTDIIPDILCLSKGLNNGVLPLGAVLLSQHVTRRIGDEDFINHFSTQNANPLCCAAAVKTIELLEREDYQSIVYEKGNHLLKKLLQCQEEFSLIKAVRGEGMMLAVELDMDDDFDEVLSFSNQLKTNGLLCYPYANKYSTGLMLLPTYTMTYSELNQIVLILSDTVREYATEHQLRSN